jgi:hypothetical protein
MHDGRTAQMVADMVYDAISGGIRAGSTHVIVGDEVEISDRWQHRREPARAARAGTHSRIGPLSLPARISARLAAGVKRLVSARTLTRWGSTRTSHDELACGPSSESVGTTWRSRRIQQLDEAGRYLLNVIFMETREWASEFS